jgi:hypothetical protein
MYMLLLMFGALLSAAGVVLAGLGVSPRDGTFDAAILTPGIVAAIGGLLLVGLGAGLRTLQRIERTLASRPMPRGLPIAESAKTPESIETPRDPARIPFAPKPSDSTAAANKTSPPVPLIAIPAAYDANVEAAAQRSSKSGNGAGRRTPGRRSACRRVCAARANAQPNPASMRCGRKVHVHRGAKRRPFRLPRLPGLDCSQAPMRLTRQYPQPIRTMLRPRCRCSNRASSWHAVHALLGWLDRGTVAGGHAAVSARLPNCVITLNRALEHKGTAVAARRLQQGQPGRRNESAPPSNGSHSSAAA